MPAAARLLIKNGTLIDGSGRRPVTNGAIVIEGNKIARVEETARAAQPGETVIDAAGK